MSPELKGAKIFSSEDQTIIELTDTTNGQMLEMQFNSARELAVLEDW